MFGKQGNTKQEPDFEYFSIYDSKVNNYRDPISAINRYDLLRQIQNDFSNPKYQDSQILVNAEDFSLFKIGEFYKKTGQLVACQPEHVANLHEIRTMVQRTLANAQRSERNAEQLGIVPT